MQSRKVSKVMSEFSRGDLHSGSKNGPTVSNPKQAIAIAYSEARHAASKKKDTGSAYDRALKKRT